MGDRGAAEGVKTNSAASRIHRDSVQSVSLKRGKLRVQLVLCFALVLNEPGDS